LLILGIKKSYFSRLPTVRKYVNTVELLSLLYTLVYSYQFTEIPALQKLWIASQWLAIATQSWKL